ncbi:hypothetical protein RCM58_20970, partial [Escherichia marmotae]|nr:hypothetical protein [Escherichia marmotae]
VYAVSAILCTMPDATLARLIRPTNHTHFVGRKGVFAASAVLCSMPDATLTRLIMPTNHTAHFNKLSFAPIHKHPLLLISSLIIT